MKSELIKEIWKPVPIKDFEELYEVSNKGNYRRNGIILKPSMRQDGYLNISFSKNGKVKNFTAHRIVALAFIPNPLNLSCINHKNEIKTDNRVENLEWCDHKYNNNYGTHTMKVKEKLSGRTNTKRSKPVLQFTLDGEFVKEWPSAMECNRNGFNQSHVSECCRGETKQYKSFIWRYK